MTADIALTTLIRNPALNADGEDVGRVIDFLFDITGSPTAVVLQLGGVMGVGARQVAIPFAECEISVSETGPHVRLTALKTGEVLVASAYEPADGTAFDRLKERAGELSQTAITKAAEVGRSVSQSASELGARAAEKSAAAADSLAARLKTGDEQEEEMDHSPRSSGAT